MGVTKIKSKDFPIEIVLYQKINGVWIIRTKYNDFLGSGAGGKCNRSHDVAEFIRNFNRKVD